MKKKSDAGPRKSAGAVVPVSSYLIWITLGAIMAAALFLRVQNLGYISYWGDELNHVFAANSLIESGAPLLPSGQAYTGALSYTRMVSMLVRLFGDGEAVTRMLSVVFNLLAIPMLYILGTRFFGDRRVGMLAAVFFAVAPWYVFRSRIVRMYTMFQFLYLVFLYLFYRAYEWTPPAEDDGKGGGPGVLKKFGAAYGIHPIMLTVAMLLLFFSLKIQAFAFEAGPTVLVYAAAAWILERNRFAGTSKWLNKYSLPVYAGILVLGSASYILDSFFAIPADAIFHGWSFVGERLAAEPFYALRKYVVDTVLFLHPVMWIPGVAGLVLIFVKPRKAPLFMAIALLVPFLLQSFIFIHPNTIKAKYLFFVFPLFLVAAAYAVIQLHELIMAKFLPGRSSYGMTVLVLLAAATAVMPLKQSWTAVTSRHHGDLKDKSSEMFANWREACAYVAAHRDSSDCILSTQPWSVYQYLGDADYYVRTGYNRKLMLREGFRDTPKFRKNTNPPVRPLRELYSGSLMLRDFNSFMWMVRSTPRGWLIGCHKLFNPAFVDKRILQFISKNMKQMYVDKDRSVVVYRWAFRPERPAVIMGGGDAPRSFAFKTQNLTGFNGEVRLQLNCRGMDPASAAALRFNGSAPLEWHYSGHGEREVAEALVAPALFRPGANTVSLTGTVGAGLEIYDAGVTVKSGAADYSLPLQIVPAE